MQEGWRGVGGVVVSEGEVEQLAKERKELEGRLLAGCGVGGDLTQRLVLTKI